MKPFLGWWAGAEMLLGIMFLASIQTEYFGRKELILCAEMAALPALLTATFIWGVFY